MTRRQRNASWTGMRILAVIWIVAFFASWVCVSGCSFAIHVWGTYEAGATQPVGGITMETDDEVVERKTDISRSNPFGDVGAALDDRRVDPRRPKDPDD